MAKKKSKKKRKVKAPSGLAITRNGDKYTFSWTKGESYQSDQQLQVCFVQTDKKKESQDKDKTFERARKSDGEKHMDKNAHWTNIGGITKSSTHHTIDKKNDFYPHGKSLDGVFMRVKGINGSNKDTEKESDWSFKSFNVKAPSKPKIQVEWGGSDAEYTSKFVAVSPDSEHVPVERLRWQTRLTTSTAKDDNGWGALQTKEGDILTKTFNERNVTTNYVRGLRVKAEGAGGWTDWTYAFHSYAVPMEPKNLTLKKAVIDKAAQKMTITVGWNAPNSGAKPVETDIIEYYIGVPDLNFNPTSGSWQTGKTVKDTSDIITKTKVSKTKSARATSTTAVNKNKKKSKKQELYGRINTYKKTTEKVTVKQYATFIVDQLLSEDQCMWIRVKAVHDGTPNPSDVTIFKKLIGNLKAPTIKSIVETTTNATFTVTPKTSAGGAYIGVIYHNEKDPENDGKIIGIDAITSSDTDQTFTANIPKCEDVADVSYELYNFIPQGGASGISTKSVTYYNISSYTVTEYTFTDRMSSEKVTDITPDYPTDVKVEKTNISGTVQVTWKNQWQEATGTEVAWASNEDALYSTAAPNTFTVQNAKQQKLNVSGLDLGIPWYFWVRLFKTVDGVDLYGPYSDMKSIDLSSEPAIPNLSMTPSTGSVTVNGTLTLSWVFVTTDDSYQQDAYLYEVTDGNPNPVYTPIETNGPISSSQTYDIEPDILGWNVGSTHRVVVQVVSTSGRTSGYSNEATIRVADAIDCYLSVAGSGVVTQVNPTTYTSNSSDISITDSDGGKYIYQAKQTFPYNANKYTGTALTVNGTTIQKSWYNSDPQSDTPTDVNIDDFYGGTFEFITGTLISLYAADGTTLATPKEYDLGDSLLALDKGSNTIGPNGVSTEVIVTDNAPGTFELTDLPFTVTVHGAGEKGISTLAIRRVGDYVIDRPDESTRDGYDGETVAYFVKPGEPEITINAEDIYGYLDDRGKYILEATATDVNNQIDDDNYGFIVKWAHQAVKPSENDVDITIDDGIAKILVNAPTGTLSTDKVDIYRLSADKPTLIYHNALFYDQSHADATTYVDPYPTIGKRGGYRIVVITKNGDYISSGPQDDPGETPAWEDFDGSINTKFQLINYDGKELPLKYNVNLESNWNKSFTKTHYLGGSIQGDWLAGVEKAGSLKGNVFDDLDPEDYESFRDLGDYPGLCHVRSIEGANYTANIDVSDSSTFNSLEHQHDISLTINRVDNVDLDGMTLEDWKKVIQGE